jgi:hypothetical protein
MTSAKTVTATFTKGVVLTVNKGGNGSGTVTSTPVGISCGSVCTALFGQGTTVTLTAAPGTGSVFTGWSGACSGTGACTVAMKSAKTVTATFTKSVVLTATQGGAAVAR